jgi:hypothetical protein
MPETKEATMPLPDDVERDFREREVSVKEKEQRIAEFELKLKEREQAASSWRNPLVVAILAAAIAAAGNAGISVYNGRSQRQLESQKADQARVLEMLRTNGDKELAAGNLQFLLDAGLIADADFQRSLRTFLSTRKHGSGPTLISQDSGQQLSPPVISNARIYVLTGKANKAAELDDLDRDLKASGFPVLGAKYLFDPGRPDAPEVRYFNAADKAQADVLAEFLKFRLNGKEIQETIYHVATARPGYIEIWLGR